MTAAIKPHQFICLTYYNHSCLQNFPCPIQIVVCVLALMQVYLHLEVSVTLVAFQKVCPKVFM